MFRTRDLSEGQRPRCGAAIARTGGPYTALTLHLLHNPCHRSCDTAVLLSEAALALPRMGGAGWVRDLREAIILSEQQGARPGAAGALIALVQALAAADTLSLGEISCTQH